jgi:hypothetical protein
MTPKSLTETEPEADQNDAEEGAYQRREKPKADRLYFYPLEHYQDDRRSDPRARGELAGVLPLTDDYEEKFARIALPGWYCVEHRHGGSIADSWVLEIEPDVRVVEAEATLMPQPHAPAGDVEVILERMLARQREDFERRLAEQREDFERQAAERAKAEENARPLDPMRDALALLREMRAIDAELMPTPKATEKADPAENFLDQLDRFTTVAERISPIRESNGSVGVIGQLASLVESLGRHGSTLVPVLMSMLPQPAPSPAPTPSPRPQPTVTPSPSPTPMQANEPITETLTFEFVFARLIEDLTDDNEPSDTAEIIMQLLSEQPEYAAQIEGLMSRTTPELLTIFSQASGTNFDQDAHKVWIDDLRTELVERRKASTAQAS